MAFMVLVRQRGRLAATLVRALKTRRVEVGGVDRMSLTEQLAVMDLMALGDFLLLPGDDLTLACLLKGPFIGFSEDRLFELAHKRTHPSLWKTLTLRRDENPDFARAHETLSALLKIADYKPPFEFYNEYLGAGGGRQQLLQRLGMEASDPIDEFLSAALSYEHQHPPSLQGFLHWLRAAKTELKRDAAYLQRLDAVLLQLVGDRDAQPGDVLVVGAAADLGGHAVQEEALLGVEADGADAERQAHLIGRAGGSRAVAPPVL